MPTNVGSSAKVHTAGKWQSWDGRSPSSPGSEADSLSFAMPCLPMRCSFLCTMIRRPKGVLSDADETQILG